ncbi:MAG TPA: ACT domain-containing protein [Acidobacteriota bacterium]
MLASLPLAALPAAARLLSSARGGFGAVVAERDEVTLTMERSQWQSSALRRRARGEAGPFRAITIDLDLGFEVCGFLAPAAERLAGAGVSIVPQCGYRKDHLLVLETQLERALQSLQALMRASRKQARAAGIRIADP